MKYLIASLFLFLWEHSSLSSHPCYIGTEEYNNVVVEQKDSVLRERISSNRFEEIRLVHKEEACLRNLKRSPYWEISEYGQKQKSIFKQMEYGIIKQIPIRTLCKSLEYKFNPVILELIIAPRDGVVKRVSFQINHEISSDFSDVRSFDTPYYLRKNSDILLVRRFTSKEDERSLQCGIYLKQKYSQFECISTQNKMSHSRNSLNNWHGQ